MKTAMKRLLSLVLVAMMLVSVVPFQASAATVSVTAGIWLDAEGGWQPVSGDISVELTKEGDDATFTVEDLLADSNVSDALSAALDNYNNKDEVHRSGEGKVSDGATLVAGGTYYILVTEKTAETFDVLVNIVDEAGKSLESFKVAENVAKDQLGNYTKYDAEKLIADNAWAKDYIGTGLGQYTLKSASGAVTDEVKGTVTYTVTVSKNEAPVAWNFLITLDGAEKVNLQEGVAKGESAAAKLDAKVATVLTNAGLKAEDVEITKNVDADKLTATAAITVKKIEEDKDEDKEEEEEVKGVYNVTFLFCGEKDCAACDETGECDAEYRTTTDGKLRDSAVPTIPARYGYTFSYWKNVTNDTKGLLETYTSDVTYKAVYKEDADSDMNKLKVFGIIYNDGKTNILSTPLATIYATDETDLLKALQAKANDIQTILDGRGYSEDRKYTWDGVTFYDHHDMDSEDKVATGTEVTGNGNYYIKVKYTGENKVQLYIHTSKTLKIKDTVTVTTYAPGEKIDKADIGDAIKDAGWSISSYKTYTRDSWEKIVDRDTTSAASETRTFTVGEGETEIHVYLTGSQSGSSSGSVNNSDNPKTGDTILMAVTAMGLSATALAAIYFFTKKKQAI